MSNKLSKVSFCNPLYLEYYLVHGDNSLSVGLQIVSLVAKQVLWLHGSKRQKLLIFRYFDRES